VNENDLVVMMKGNPQAPSVRLYTLNLAKKRVKKIFFFFFSVDFPELLLRF